MLMKGNDEQFNKVFDEVAQDLTYQRFCEFFNNVKRNINEFFIVSNKKVAKYQSAKVATQKELFQEIEKLYIDNVIYLDEVTETLRNQFSSKYIKEKDFDSFKGMKSELIRTCKDYKEVLDGIESGIKNLDKNLFEKVEQEKERRKQERIEAEKRRRAGSNRSKDDDDDSYQSSSSHDDFGPGSPMNPFGFGPGIFG